MNIWIFGDSYSCEWEDVVGKRHKQYVKDYKPTIHFSNIMKEELNCDNMFNGSKSGNCNYSILQSVCDCIDRIQKDDIVIIGWSEITRWRSVSFGKQWRVVGVNFNHTSEEFRKESVNRNDKRIVSELNSWIKLLDFALPNQIVHWTPFQSLTTDSRTYKVQHKNHPELNILAPPFHMKRISEETEIPDWHITEEGHIDIAKWLISVVNKTNEYEKVKTTI